MNAVSSKVKRKYNANNWCLKIYVCRNPAVANYTFPIVCVVLETNENHARLSPMEEQRQWFRTYNLPHKLDRLQNTLVEPFLAFNIYSALQISRAFRTQQLATMIPGTKPVELINARGLITSPQPATITRQVALVSYRGGGVCCKHNSVSNNN